MEKELLNEINRVRSLMSLPLLNEQAWIDDLIRKGTLRISSVDDILKKLNLVGKNLTDAEIDNLVGELPILEKQKQQLKSLIKSEKSVRNSLTNTSSDFVNSLKAAAKKKNYDISGFAVVKSLNKQQIDNVVKNLAIKLLNDTTSNVYSGFKGLDDAFVEELTLSILNTNRTLRNAEEIYDIADTYLIQQLSNDISKRGLDQDVAEQIYLSFRNKLRTNSETKKIIDDLKAQGRISNKPKRTKTISTFDTTQKIDDVLSDSTNWVDDSVKVTDNLPTVTTKKEDFEEIVKISDEAEEIEYTPFEEINPDEVIEETTENIFQKYGESIDFDFLRSTQWLKKEIDNTGNETLKKILNMLKKGKKISFEDFNKNQYEFRKILGDNYNIITKRLLNPKITKLNTLQAFFWTTVEPLVKNFKEFLTPKYFENLAKKLGFVSDNFDFYFQQFKNRLEKVMLDFTSKEPISSGELKKLKDEFLRLSSPAVESNLFYDQLWSDLNDYLMKNLDESSKKEWLKIVQQMKQEKGSNWRYVTWSEIIGDKAITEAAENISFKKMSGIKNLSPLDFTEDFAKRTFKSGWKRWGSNLISFLMTGNFRTPKQMQEFLIKKGYAKSGVKTGVPFLELSAGGANFVSNLLTKYLYVPFATATLGSIFYAAIEYLTKTDIDIDQKFLDMLINPLSIFDFVGTANEEFKKYAPEWYSLFEPFLYLTSPVMNISTTLVASTQAYYPSVEERAHIKADDAIKKIETDLKPDNKILSNVLDSWKNGILNIMANDPKYGLTQEKANKIVKNMKTVVYVDPTLKKKIHDYITELFKKDESLFEKGLALQEINKEYGEKIEGSKITDIVVETPEKTYKMLNSSEIKEKVFNPKNERVLGIIYVKPDYEELKKGNPIKTYHNLNELNI